MATRFFARQIRRETSTPVQRDEPILKYKFEGHKNAIWSFVFLHDSVHIVSGSGDGTMRKWNYDTGLVVGEPWKGEGGRIYTLALSPDARIIACGREDGSVQRWTTDGEMIKGIWTGHSKAVRSLSWSPNGSHVASGSDDGKFLIRNAKSGKVVGSIRTKQGGVRALAYSPSGERIASGGDDTIHIWDTKTRKLVVGPITSLGNSVTSLVWSSDNTKLYSASDKFARVFDSKSAKLLHSFEHDNYLYSVALSTKHNVLVCVGLQGVAQLWDTESHQPLGQSFHQNRNHLFHVSFSQDGSHLAYGGFDEKLTLWMTVKDMVPQLPASTLLQKRDKRRTQQETRSNSSSSCLDADATGGSGLVEEAHDDPYNNFFQSSQQSLPSPSPGFRLPPLFSARHLWNVVPRRRLPPDESVPQERSKRGFFSRRASSNLSLELATIKHNQSVPERKVGEGEGEQGGNTDNHGSVYDALSITKNKGKQRDYPPDNMQSSPSYDRTLPAHLDSKDSLGHWGRLMQARGKNHTFGFGHSSPPPANAPQPILHNPRQWNSSDACRDEDVSSPTLFPFHAI
ncbi:WD40-repeat-containing domain protein [Suillus subluteus]|nr:WD40-repeat-containing domain protein [Suillus subluteus]